MKTTLRSFILNVALGAALALPVLAAEKKIEGGPKGGRILDATKPKAEFYVEKDRSVTIAFYDASLKPVPSAGQRVSVIAEAKGGKTTLEFENKDGVLASKTKLPEGEGYNLVVLFRQAEGAKPQNFRFKLDLAFCGGCKRAEYACTCGH